ncbi:fatty acid amide hydrolase-like protein [Tanacetum coccineum]
MYQNKVPVRGDIHVIIVGDHGLGKSQLLQATASVSPRGPKFMWDNCRRGTSNVKKCLDMFMATPSWAAMYHLHYCQNLPRVASYHSRVAHGLSIGLGADPTSLLVACELQVRNSDDTKEKTMLHQEIKELLTREEILWRQRSRIQWLKDDALSIFSETHGCKVVEIVIPELDEMRTAHVVSIGSEAVASLTPDFQDGGTRLTLDSCINFALFNSFTAADYVAAQRLRRRIMYYHTEIFKTWMS